MDHIYFISQPNTGRIKIGTTRNLNTRLTGIAQGLADRVLLLGNIEGGLLLERAIHDSLSKYRLQGEWFRDCEEVRTAIDNLLAKGPETAIGFVGPRSLPKKFIGDDTKKFGRVCKALWPTRTALNLAQRIGCTERAAQFYIDGERKPSARAVYSIIAEILD